MVSSLFFVVSWIGLIATSLLWKKSEEKQSLMTWGIVAVILSGSFHTFVGGIYAVAHIPVTIITIGIANLVLAAVFAFFIYRSKAVQKYTIDWCDVAYVGAMFVFALYTIKKHYWGFNLMVNYTTIDPAAHMKAAMDVVMNQRVQGMFHSPLNNAIIIEALMPIFGIGQTYKSFVFAELLNLLFAGFAFYGVAKLFAKDTYSKIVIIFVSFFYLWGYPLCNAEFGFVYLGMCVTLVAILFIIMDAYLNERVNRTYLIISLCLLCTAVVQCYMYFAPVTYFAVIAVIFYKAAKEKQLISLKTVRTCLEVFLIPCIYGIFFSFIDVFTGGLTVGTQIGKEGGTYGDLFSNFVFLVPFVLWGVWRKIKEHEFDFMLSYGLCLLLFMGGLMVLCLQRRVSAYYFYKSHFMLWLLCFIFVAFAVCNFKEQEKRMFHAFAAVFVVIFLMFSFKIEEKIQNKNPFLCNTNRSEQYLDIYRYTTEFFDPLCIVPEKVFLYQYLSEEYLKGTGASAVVAAGWEDTYWFEAITDQRLHDWQYICNDVEQFEAQVQANRPTYILVVYASEIYQGNKKYFDAQNIVFENRDGCIIQLQ